MFCVPASESQWQPVQTSTNLNIHHVPVIHRPAVGRRWLIGQNLSILIDTERPQLDGVRRKAWTREWWKVGSFWHHLLTGERKAAWVRDRAMLLALDPGVMCVERDRRPGPLPALAVLLLLLPCWENIHLPLRLTLRLFPHSFVMSPISCMNRNAVTMMDGDPHYIQKQKQSSTQLEIMFLVFLYCFIFCPFSFCFIPSEDSPSAFFKKF